MGHAIDRVFVENRDFIGSAIAIGLLPQAGAKDFSFRSRPGLCAICLAQLEDRYQYQAQPGDGGESTQNELSKSCYHVGSLHGGFQLEFYHALDITRGTVTPIDF